MCLRLKNAHRYSTVQFADEQHIKLQRIFPLMNTFCVDWWVPMTGCWCLALRCTCPCTNVPGPRAKARAAKQQTKITRGLALLQKARSVRVSVEHW